MTHLIVIRGNSAAGKTSLAAQLQRALGRGTANIGQDHFRRVVLREHDIPDGNNIEFIAHTVRYCLAINYHVVLEGILYSPHYGAMLRELVADHAGPSHVFYLEVPLEETLRRHEARPLSADVPSSKLREWYHDSDLLGIPGETVIDGTSTQHDVLAAILDEVGPADRGTTAARATATADQRPRSFSNHSAAAAKSALEVPGASSLGRWSARGYDPR